MYDATIIIKLKKGVLNPEGRTVLRALNFLGYDGVKDAKTFKCVELTIEGDNEEEVYNKVDDMCKKLLANPVIHDYEITLKKIE
jgi:phosphoribosylformylglycinamidine synthase